MTHIPALVWVPERDTVYVTFKGSGVLSADGDPLMVLQDVLWKESVMYEVFWSESDLRACLAGKGVDPAQVRRVEAQ